MEPRLRDQKYEEIDAAAELDKRRVAYIINLIESCESTMRAVLLSDEEREMSELDIAQLLFKRLESTLRNVQSHIMRDGIDIDSFKIGDAPSTPEVDLGWITYDQYEGSERYRPDRDGPLPRFVRVTSEGTHVVDEMLQAQGLPTTDEQLEARKKVRSELTIDIT